MVLLQRIGCGFPVPKRGSEAWETNFSCAVRADGIWTVRRSRPGLSRKEREIGLGTTARWNTEMKGQKHVKGI